MPTVAIISFSDLSRDPRVDRQIRTIGKTGDYSVLTVGLSAPAVPVRRHVDLVPLRSNLKRKLFSLGFLVARRYEDYSLHSYNPIRVISDLKDFPVDLVIANDFNSLPLANALVSDKGSRFLLDAHEYAPRQYDERLKWKILHKPYNYFLGRRYLPKLDGMMTVSEGIAQEYQSVFGVIPQVITNAPSFARLAPSEVRKDGIRLVYHGSARPARRIERIIGAMRLVRPGATLDMLLMPAQGCESYFLSLKRSASKQSNVRLMAPVAMSDLVSSCNEYDAGICFLPATNFNQKHALPNKFFEYIQSRLALVIGPSPEMAKYVERYGLGVLANDFTSRSLAEAINGLTQDSIKRYKRNADTASKALSAESNMESFMKIVESLVCSRTT